MTVHLLEIDVHEMGNKFLRLVKSYLAQKGTKDFSADAYPAKAKTVINPTQTAVASSQAQTKTIQIPISLFLKSLPSHIQPLFPNPLDQVVIEVPRTEFIQRISTGRFKLTLAELCQWAKGIDVIPEGHNQIEITLPLNVILSFITPGELPRKKPKKRIIPPLDIPHVFEPPKNKYPGPCSSPTQSGIGSLSETFAKDAITNPSLNDNSLESNSLHEGKETNAPHSPTVGHIPAIRVIAGFDSALPGEMPTLPEQAITRTSPSSPGQTDGINLEEPVYLTVKVSDVWEKWPQELKRRLELHGFEDATLAIPITYLEAELKKGRFACPAETLASWLKEWQARRLFVSAHVLTLELPLNVIVPKYLQLRRKPPTETHKLSPPIPQTSEVSSYPPTTRDQTDVFSLAQLGIRWKPVSETKQKNAAESTPHYLSKSHDGTMRRSSPHDIISQALALPGVDGALITIGKGVIIAADLPKPINPQGAAELIHNAFETINQTVTVLRDGYTNRLSFTVSKRTWAIFKRGPLYLGAVSKLGQPLPEEALGLLADELEQLRQRTHQAYGNP